MKRHRYLVWSMIFLAFAVLQACGNNGSSNSGNNGSTGSLSVLVSDAPGDFDNVYITVKDIWFHTSSTAGPNEAGWAKKPLAAPVTVDLLTLANGNMQALWSNVSLPAGDYQQIRLVLADSDDPLTTSATAAGLQYNNQVVVNGVAYPLTVPDSSHGILLTGRFTVAANGTLRLVIDFDAGHDVVELRHGTEYVLKPRLSSYDLDNAGAIIGKLSLSTGQSFTRTPHFVIKAERLSGDGTYHVVKRWTAPRADGTFVLYPVSAATTSVYDILIRGLNYQTVIIRGVPVIRGTAPLSGATDLGTIAMTAATTPDFLSNCSITSPTGAWANFYQTLPGAAEAPYEVRFRHFLPLTGNFANYPLSRMPILIGSYGSGNTPISLAPVAPQEGAGGYQVVADAILYVRSGWSKLVSAATPTVALGPLSVQPPWSGNTVSGSLTLNNPLKMNNKMNNGILFAVHGGMIVNAIDVSSQMGTGGAYTMPNLPGGAPGQPLPFAFYGVEAIGWSSTPMPMSTKPYRAVALPAPADLRTGNAAGVDMNMLPLW